MKIAIPGIAGSFHHQAALLHANQDLNLIACETFASTYKALADKTANFAVIAIENAIAGSILPNYGLTRQHGFHIVNELHLPIALHLLALPGVKLADIRVIRSHPMAIAQCSPYLEKLLAEYPAITIIEQKDTAFCAKAILKQNLLNEATLAGDHAAEHYKLNMLNQNTHSHALNYTKFWVLATEPLKNPAANKASICFRLPHKKGALARILGIFAASGLDLLKIQSVPILGSIDAYYFYVDLTWQELASYEKALEKVKPLLPDLSCLGKYKANPMVWAKNTEQGAI